MGSELDRIRRVYRSYGDDDRRRSRWDASAPANRAMVAERWRLIDQLLQRQGIRSLSGWRVLEVGCGTGGNLTPLTRLGLDPESFTGVDLLADRVGVARHAYPNVGFAVADGGALPFPAGVFDAVLFSTVFSSVLAPSVCRAISADAARILRPGGLVLWYDMRVGNPRNRNVAGVGRRRLGEFFPGMEASLRSATVAPPLSRALGPAVTRVYPLLALVPLLRTHWVGVLRKADR